MELHFIIGGCDAGISARPLPDPSERGVSLLGARQGVSRFCAIALW